MPLAARADVTPTRTDADGSSSRIAPLDGLRAFAILSTLLLHYELRSWPYQDGLLRPAWLFVTHSWLGVECFFVLSGFLITGILVDSKGSEHYWRNYYARRVLRVFPLYYVALVAAFVVLPRLGGDAIGASPVAAGTQVWYWTYLSNVLVAFRGWRAAPALLPHFWTMAIEEQFYLLWPLVVYVVPRYRLRNVAVACAAGSLVARAALLALTGDHRYGWLLAVSRFDGLAIGAASAILLREAGTARCRRIAARWGMVLAVAVLAMSAWRHWANYEDAVIGTVGVTAWSLLLGCLVLGLVAAPAESRLARAFAIRPLRLIGKYSYGLYVWHYFVLVILARRGFTVDALVERFGSIAMGHGAFIAVNASLTMFVALASWYLLERPCLGLKRYFPYAPTSPALAPTAAARDGAMKQPSWPPPPLRGEADAELSA